MVLFTCVFKQSFFSYKVNYELNALVFMIQLDPFYTKNRHKPLVISKHSDQLIQTDRHSCGSNNFVENNVCL